MSGGLRSQLSIGRQGQRADLGQNLTIDRDDFDNVPVLANRGGWGKANKVFDGRLAELLADVHKELVAA